MFKRVPSELTERENYKLLIGSVIPDRWQWLRQGLQKE